MSKATNLVENNKSKRARSWRGLSFVIAISLTVISTLVVGGSNPAESSEAVKAQNVSVRKGAIPENGIPNPLPTHGSRCHSKIIILVDRSHSVINNAGGGLQNVNAIKNAVKFNIDALNSNAKASGSRANVLVYAFASDTVLQNPNYAPPSPDPAVNLANFYTWVASTDVSVDANRDAMKRDVIGSSDNRGIYFRNSTSDPDWVGDPDGNPFVSVANQIKGYPAADGGTTNYENAFVTAGNVIDFWTNPTDTGDDDFDLVLMITDGVPTSNDGPGGRSGPYVNPDNQDLDRAQGAINNLRLGGFVRPPVPVYGIVAGQDAGRSDIDSIMRQTFGSGNYAKQSDWGALPATISNAIAQFSCPPPPPKWVKPKIEIEITGTSGPTVREGESGWIEGRVCNRSEVEDNAGQVALYDVRLTINGANSPEFPITPSVVIPAIGDCKSFRHDFSVPLGAPAPADKIFNARGKAFYDGSRFYPAPGFDNSPEAPQKVVPMGIERLPLPT